MLEDHEALGWGGVGWEGFESHLEASTRAEFHEQHLEF